MERDLLVMIYGAIMGVVGSIITSLVTALFQLWLDRREFERRQNEERDRQLRQIHLPTTEEVRMINSDSYTEPQETARTAAEAGSVLLSILLSSTLVYTTRDPILGFAFGALLGFYFTRRIIKALGRHFRS